MRLLLISLKSKGFPIEHKYTVALTQLSFREKKPFCGDTKKIPLRSWSDNHHSCYPLWVRDFVPFFLYSQRRDFRAKAKNSWVRGASKRAPIGLVSPERETRMATEALSIYNPRPCCIISHHNISGGKKRKVKKPTSITLINTKGYPILYTVCEIYSPYKMLSLSLDFVLILSWRVKY